MTRSNAHHPFDEWMGFK